MRRLIAADEKAHCATLGRAHSNMLHFDNEVWASEPDAEFDKVFRIDAGEIAQLVNWGTSPDQSVPIDGVVPSVTPEMTSKAKAALLRALDYMGLEQG